MTTQALFGVRGVLVAGLVTMAATLVGCGPSPEAVCDHVLEVEKAEGPKSMGRPACEMKVKFKKEKLGLVKWGTYSSCVMDAKSMAEVEKCEGSAH